MTEFDDLAARPPEPTRRHWPLGVVGAAVVVYTAVCVFWFTSDRADVPLPRPVIQAAQAWLFAGREFELPPVGIADLYRLGMQDSLLRTYTSLVSPGTWSGFFVDPAHVDWQGQALGMGAIALYTLLGLTALGALQVRWPWPTRLAVAYALGIGIAGWVFEQWAIFFLLNRWTVLGSLLLMFGLLGVLWWRAARAGEPIAAGEPTLGAPFAQGSLDLAFRVSAWVLLAILVLLSFVHAVAYPPTNWDGLILYLGYARQTHEAGGFPVKVCAQVGIGLGANYPHLYEVAQAAMTRLAGRWTPLVGQWSVPWASLAATVVVFALAHRLFRRRDLALATALIFRCVPYGIAHWQLASNYPLAVLFTAAILVAGWDWLATGRRRFAALMALLTALASHINYLMPAMWGIALPALGLRWLWETNHRPDALPDRPAPPRRWAALLVFTLFCLALASSWYVRNWAVTGNPIYAFFPEILGGKNINPSVLASAEREWLTNGDGVGRLTDQLGNRTALGNLRALPRYLFVERVFRWKLAPLFEGLTLPGLLLVLGGLPLWRRWGLIETSERLMALALALLVFLGLWFYHLAVADHYLYQILPMLVPAALLGAVPLALPGLAGGLLRVLVLLSALLVAVPMSLMGFKIKDIEAQLRLDALAHPFPAPDLFYAQAFPTGEVRIWQELAERWRGARLLTHDNRHLIYDPLVTLVHLDDCDVQPVYSLTDPGQQLAFWRERGVELYLRIPNEANHAANRWAGLQGLIDRGDLRALLRTGDARTGVCTLYAFPWARPRENGVAPADEAL